MTAQDPQSGAELTALPPAEKLVYRVLDSADSRLARWQIQQRSYGLPDSTLSRALDNLESADLITRECVGRDGRETYYRTD